MRLCGVAYLLVLLILLQSWAWDVGLRFRMVEEVDSLGYFVIDMVAPSTFYLLDLLDATVGEYNMVGCPIVSVEIEGPR